MHKKDPDENGTLKNSRLILRSVTPNNIGVIGGCDENYAHPLTVMFTSLLRNCSAPERIKLFCLSHSLSEGARSRMQQEVVLAGGAGVDFIDIDEKRFQGFPVSGHITLAAYYRIIIPELFDLQTTRIIYLDCDIIVRGDIQNLWAIDIQEYHVGAVENISSSTFRHLGIPQNEYFNSGVLFINLERWRADNIANKVLTFLVENRGRVAYHDQCALNGVLHTSWKRLPLAWNHQSGLYRPSPQVEGLGEVAVKEANVTPFIIHFIGWDKPWRKVRFHPLASEYDRYEDALSYPSRELPTKLDYLKAYASISMLKKLKRSLRYKQWYRDQGFDLYEGASHRRY